MKKLIISISFLFFAAVSMAQFPITQNIGSSSTLVQVPANGGLLAGLIPRAFADTTAASATNLKFYDGAIIKTTSPVALWYRYLAATQWLQILPSGGSSGQRAWLDGGNSNLLVDASNNAQFGSLTAAGIRFITNSTLRYILPAGGLAAHTSDVVPIGINSSTGNLSFYSPSTAGIPISSLTAATGGNSINNANFSQIWNWNSFTGDGINGLCLFANTTASALGGDALFAVSLSGANATSSVTSIGATFINGHTGTSSTNIAARFSATSASNNYAIIVPSGNGTVGIGNSTPVALLTLGTAGTTLGSFSVAGNTSGTVTIQPAAAAGTYTLTLPTTDGNASEFLQTNGSGVLTWATPTVPLSSIVAATTSSSINNAAHQVTWAWNTITSTEGLGLVSNSTTASGNTQTVLLVQNEGVNANSNQTTSAARFTNIHTGTGSINKAAIFTATGGGTNYAIQLVDGSQGNGKVLTSDASGNATWQTASGGSITVGTTTITSGTSGAIPYNAAGVYQEDATQFFWNATDNRLGIGTASPSSQLHVVGTARVIGSMDIGTTAFGDATVALSINSTAANLLGLYTNAGAERLRIDQNGSLYLTGGVGAIRFAGALMPNSAAGTSGDFLKSAGSGAPPTWVATSSMTGLPYIALSGTSTLTGAVVIASGSNALDIDGTGTINIGDLSTAGNGVLFIINDGASSYRFRVGTVTIDNLAGAGSRAVLADANGLLSAPVSDRSVKRNISTLNNGLDIVMQLNPVSFEYINGWKNYGQGTQLGFIAQEVAQVLPNSTFTTQSTGKMGYNSNDLIPVLTKAIQQQQQQIDELKNEIQNLKRK